MVRQPPNVYIVSVGVRFRAKIFPLIQEGNDLVLLAIARFAAEQLAEQAPASRCRRSRKAECSRRH